MKKNNFKRNKIENWIKVILGVVLLSWNMFNRGKHAEKIEKPPEDEKKIQKREIKPINTNKRMEKDMEKDTEKDMEKDKDKEKKGWLKAQPEKLSSPTYWPFFLALGLVFLFWGILTSWIIVLVGLFIFIISLAGWINILRHER